MATAAPWTVKTTKRKAVPNSPVPRKRRRASLPADDRAESRARIRKQQQTLTQIQWVASRPVSLDDGELEPLEVKTEPGSRSRHNMLRLKKRDSTLTQMDFFTGKAMEIELNEDDLQPLVLNAQDEFSLPQLDGTYDSPRKPRPSKTPGLQAGSHRKRKDVTMLAHDSQQYLPKSKRRKGKTEIDEVPDEGQRRRSSRQASKVPSDPAENFAVFQEKLAEIVPKSSTPRLEIKDSNGSDKGVENSPLSQQEAPSLEDAIHPVIDIQDFVANTNDESAVQPVSSANPVPKTPRRERDYVPSSQSPESLPPSTTKRHVTNRSKNGPTPIRNPLAELSTNTPTRRPVLDAKSDRKNYFTSKKKICTLKLPTVMRGSNSQADIWSAQSTSSPKANGDSQKAVHASLKTENIAGEKPIEIRSTSQAQNDATFTSSPPQPGNGETQESLMSLSAIFGIEKNDPAESSGKVSQQAPCESKVKARDFFYDPQETPRNATQYVCFLETQPQFDDDDASDFGSPVANDTQFVADVKARIPTSPLRTSDRSFPLKLLNPYGTIRISSSSSSEANALTSPLAAPKLVDRVEYQNLTTTIPTKEMSSPVLPPMPPPTQRPIAPASLPHPSQVSTQEPSQQLPQLSSTQQLRSPAQTDRITIKDSSSMHTPLSQIPAYNEDELQLQRELEGTQHRVHDADDDDDNDDDLDPRSPRKVLQFQQLYQGPDLRELQNEAADPSSQDSEVREEQIGVPKPSPPSQPANFTQNGHVTATRIEDMRKRGLIPQGYQPPAFQVRPARELLPAWMFEDDDDEDEL